MHEGPGIDVKFSNDIDTVISTAFDLYKVPRKAWVDIGVSAEKVENVGQHTEALTALFNSVIEQIDPEKKLDRVKMLRLIQIHDWPEALVGDQIVYNKDKAKEVLLKEKKKKEELEAMEKLCGKFGEKGQKLMILWQEYERGGSAEARLIKQMDKLQAVSKAWEYEKQGKAVFAQEFIDNIRERGLITQPILLRIMEEIEAKCKK